MHGMLYANEDPFKGRFGWSRGLLWSSTIRPFLQVCARRCPTLCCCWSKRCAFHFTTTMALRSAAEVRGNLDGSAISTYILYMLLVPLKFWCRHQSGHKNLGLDDVLIGLGLIAANAFFYTTMIGTLKP